MARPTFIDLFAGIGGFRLGMERAGFRCIWSCEIDRHCRHVYRRNFREGFIPPDIRKVDIKNIPDFDVLCAGFPCQSFSMAGKREGFNDTRGTLFFEICRVIKDKRPNHLLLENVEGLLSHQKGQTFATILLRLDDLGYDVEWQVLDSKNFGVPQSRRRVFIVGHLRGKSKGKIFPVIQDNPNAEMDEKVQQAPTITASYSASGYGARRPYIVDGDIKWTEVKLCRESKVKTQELNLLFAKNSGTVEREDIGFTGVNSTLILPIQHRNSQYSLIHVFGMDASSILSCPKQTLNFGAIRLKGTNGEMCKLQQLFKEKVGQLLEFGNMRLRALTPMECERLQGFPDGWTEGVSDTQRYKMLGNAVTVNVIKRLGEEILGRA